MSRIPNKTEMEALEQLVDACGLAEVLTALDVICGDKGALTRCGVIARGRARAWDGARAACEKAARRAYELDI